MPRWQGARGHLQDDEGHGGAVGGADGGVGPFAAAALAQSAGRSLVLVRADDAQGHGVGSALGKQVDEFADTFSFLEHVLGPGAPAR